MQKIIPVITLCLAFIAVTISVLGLIAIFAATVVPQVELIAAATVIVSMVLPCILTPFAYLFKKDILCRIAFYTDCVALFLSIIGIIVWLSM